MVSVSRRSIANKSRYLSIVKVFDSLKFIQGGTITNISERSGVPLATTYRAVEFLHKNRFIINIEKVVSENGRRPTIYSINPDFAYSLCIVLEKTDISMFLVDLLGHARKKSVIVVNTSDTREALLASMYNTTERMFSDCGIVDGTRSKVKIIYISAQADVDSESGRIVKFSGISCLDDFNIVDYFQDKYDKPVLITKLLHIEAVSSCIKYGQSCFRQYVYLHIGIGLGATIIEEGKVYRGASGRAGELIQIKNDNGISWEEAYNIESLSRALDAIFAGLTMTTLLYDQTEENKTTYNLRRKNEPVMQFIEDQLSKENCEIKSLVREAATGWAKIINTIHGLLDPEAIIVGGAIGSNTPRTFKLMMEILLDKYGDTYNVLPADHDVDLHETIAFLSLEDVYRIVQDEMYLTDSKQRKVK